MAGDAASTVRPGVVSAGACDPRHRGAGAGPGGAADRLVLRAAEAADAPFLRALFTEVRAGLLALLPPEGPAREVLLDLQFQAQERAYRAAGDDVQFCIVCLDGQDIGRLTTARRPGWLHLMDVALARAWQGRGIGTRLIGDLRAQAAAQGIGMRLSVAADNAAGHLYRRLGFVVMDEDAVYRHLVWRPATGGDHGAT